MKPFGGYEAKKQGGEREKLPAGGYVAQILNAEELQYDWGSVLLLSFDVAEGDFKAFFRKDFEENTNEDRKWRGTYRLRIPKDDGSDKDAWTKRAFGGAMWAIEDSNPGYHWDWNETGLKGRQIGVLFRNQEWEIGEKTGWTTACCKLISADDVREGRYKMPKDKPLDKPQQADGFTEYASAAADEKLPWDVL